MAVSIVGWLALISTLPTLSPPETPVTFLIIVLFLWIAQQFPMPIWKGFNSLSFPLVYALDLLYGLPITLLSYAIISLLVSVIHKRPTRVLFFNPAQLVLSYVIARWLATAFLSLDLFLQLNVFTIDIAHLLLVTLSFFLINNLFVDCVLLIRPQSYPFKYWRQKSLSEFSVAFISVFYGLLMIVLGEQIPGVINVFFFFFFFSPLVGISILSSIIVRLQKERNRLKALFTITNQLNRELASNQSFHVIRDRLQEFIGFDACILWGKEKADWEVLYEDGYINSEHSLIENEPNFEEITKTKVYFDQKDSGPAEDWFSNRLKSFVYSPLKVEEEIIGMLVVGRTRTQSFRTEDIQSIVTLSNQLGITIKTKKLVEEQEKHKILEERNRIARGIHDGVAQTLAGAVMNLESAQKKYSQKPDDAFQLIQGSIGKLRGSLKEVRQSIYALRPYPTERIGIKQALKKKIVALEYETKLHFTYSERGTPIPLSSMVEKVMFDVFQESLRNIVKHAKASKVDILLSYKSEHVLLKIKDDGVGFSLFDAMVKARKEPHFGILNMNEQTEKLGATLQIDSKENQGTIIQLVIPKLEEVGLLNEYQQRNVVRK